MNESDVRGHTIIPYPSRAALSVQIAMCVANDI